MERFGIDEVYGMHNMPGIPLGSFAIRKGGIMAAPTSSRSLSKVVAAMRPAAPHDRPDHHRCTDRRQSADDRLAQCRSDPIRGRVRHPLSRRLQPQHHSQRRVDCRTVRSLDETVRDLAQDRIKQMAEGIALANGAEAEVVYERYCPVTFNMRRDRPRHPRRPRCGW